VIHAGHGQGVAMKLGFIAHTHLEGIEEDCRFAVEHGFNGLEFNYWANFKELDADTVRRMRGLLDSYAIECSTLGLWGWNHIAPDREERAEAHRQLGRAIEFAQILGAPTLIAGGGEYSQDLDENVRVFAEAMRPFIDRASAAGIRTALYGFHGGFLRSGAAYKRLWQTVDDVGLKFDPANVDHAGEDYVEILRRHAARIWHVHIKEHLNHGGEVVSEPAAGMGDIHWGKVMAFLYEAGYQGYLTIEPHGRLWSKEPLRRTMLLLTQRHIRQFLV
jgi:sugar phosphate isomerase/epimerase